MLVLSGANSCPVRSNKLGCSLGLPFSGLLNVLSIVFSGDALDTGNVLAIVGCSE